MLCAIVFVFFLFYIFSIARKKKQPVVEERESLITENEEIARQSVAQNVAAYQPPASSENVEVMHRQNSESDEEEEE